MERRDRAGAVLLAVAIVASALGFGAQHTPVLLICAGSAAGAAALLSPSRAPRGTWLLAALGAYCLLQIVPLPFGLLSWLSPAAAAVWRGAFVPFGEGTPHFATLSLDPSATALEALKWSAYACVLAAATGFRERRRSIGLALLVFGSALAVCVVTLAHGALNIERIYGLFPSPNGSRWVRGPFVNGNNLAGYLNLGFFAGAGVALSKRAERLTPLLVAGVVLLGIGSLLASSRAGTVSLLLGILAFTYLLVHQRWGTPKKVALIATTVAVSTFALAAAVSGQRVFSTLLDTQFKAKVSVWRWTLDLIRDFPVFGVGRGGFDTGFQPYRHPLGHDWTTIYVHTENFPLQWAADWGLPVATVALVAWSLAARRAVRRARGDAVAAGLVTGLAVLLLQNLADLGLELFAVTAAALLAFAGADEPRDSTGRAPLLGVPQLLVAVAACIVVALHAVVPQVERAHAAADYAALAGAPRGKIRQFRAGLRLALRRHPGDAYLPLLGGLASARLGQDPLPWLGRALERSPLDGPAHLALSDVLAQRGAVDQSLMHARFAALYDGLLREQALARIAARTHSEAALFLSAFPAGMPGSELLASTCDKLAPELIVRCWQEVVERQATPEAELSLTVALLEALGRTGPPCGGGDRASCSSNAVRLLDRLEARDGGKDWRLFELRARFAALAGDPARAARILLEHCPGGSEAPPCLERALGFAETARDAATVEAVARPYAAVACGDPPACAALHERLGRILLGLDAKLPALPHFLDAAKMSPTLERWLITAETAARLRSRVTAQLALDRAQREPDLGPEQQGRLTAVRELLLAPAPDE